MTEQQTAAMRQALEALEALELGCPTFASLVRTGIDDKRDAAITALRQALEQPADEPHSWYSAAHDEWMTNKTRKEHKELNSYTHKVGGFDLPLYTRPQPAAHVKETLKNEHEQQPAAWVELSPEEIWEIAYDRDTANGPLTFARAVEAKLKEKNT